LIFIFGIISIFLLPYIIISNNPGISKDLLLGVQILIAILVLIGSVYYYLNRTKKFRIELKQNTKKSRLKKLINKDTNSKRKHTIYYPENIKDPNIYYLQFDNMTIKVTKEIYDQVKIDESLKLYFTSTNDIFLNFEIENNTYYC